MNKKAKAMGSFQKTIVGLLLLMVVLVGFYVWKTAGTPAATIVQSAVTVPNSQGQAVAVSPGCSISPAYTYSGVDVFAGAAIGGTNYIKVNGNVPVTSLAAPSAGDNLQMWMSNASAYCEVANAGTVQCGPHQVQTSCYLNGTVTLKLFDIDNNRFVQDTGTTTASTYNLSVTANTVNNLRITYQGTAKKAAMPFGGCMAIDTPTNIASITVNGQGVTSLAPCPYTWSFVPSSGNVYQTFAIPAGFDKAGLGDNKQIDLQIKSGASAGTGTMKVTLQPANYYVGQDGNFYLDLQKSKNQDTTKTGLQTMVFTAILQ